MKTKKVVIVADGGCLNNGRPNAVAYYSFKVWIDGYDFDGCPIRYTPEYKTNQAAELNAAVCALSYVIALDLGQDDVTLKMDSMYAIGYATGAFKLDPKAPNYELKVDLKKKVALYSNLKFEHIDNQVVKKILGH